MTTREKILSFINEMDYLNNEHVLGILFYGSYLTGFNTEKSDIDLHVIFDDEDDEHLIRGNKVIDGTRIEYFEKPLGEIYQIIDEDYQSQNNAMVSIIGNGKIIYDKDENIKRLQEYVLTKFSNKLPPLSSDESKEQVSIINNRMEKLKKYAEIDSPFFEHLYHLTIEKIRRFYHRTMGFPSIEASKGFRLYKDSKYREAFSIEQIPEQEFINMYFASITSNNLSKQEKYRLLNDLYEYAKRNITLGNEYRIPIKSRNENFSCPIIYPQFISDEKQKEIPTDTLKKILKFIKEMNYLCDEHCLGVIVCGSSLTGFNTKDSDIDLQVIFDNDRKQLIRGSKIIDGVKIEYFEKPIDDIYLEIENGFLNQNNASLSIIGKGSIVFEKDRRIRQLQQHALNKFNDSMPGLTEEESKEYVSIINNRMEKLESLAKDNDQNFDHYCHLTIDRIRKFYHKKKGISKIPTSKVYRIYTDEEYRKSVYKENPDQEFIDMYLNLITSNCENKLQRFNQVREFYDYATKDITLGNDYRVLIKRRTNR